MADLIPDYCESLTAWRMWHVKDSDQKVRLISLNTVWKPNIPVRAIHHKILYLFPPPHSKCCNDSPCEEWDESYCGCGIYGFKTFDECMKNLVTYLNSFSRSFNRFVVGTVSLWGRVIEHQRGYRAQYAYPKQFVYLSGGMDPNLLAEYRIPYQKEEEIVCRLETQLE